MSYLENTKKLRVNEKIDLRNTVIQMKVFKCNYELRPEAGEFSRRTAYVLAESSEMAALLIKKSRFSRQLALRLQGSSCHL